MQAVVCCLEAYADVPAVTTPLLKFMSEFVFNKSQRLTFDSSSANGILLFREVSGVVSYIVPLACVCVVTMAEHLLKGAVVLRHTQVQAMFCLNISDAVCCVVVVTVSVPG
jgi:hypothetical protein